MTSAPRVATILTPVLAALCVACEREPPLNVLFVSVDTTRADHLGCYGYTRPTSPNIDALARSGHRFNAAYTVMPTTLPSHASMFTSLYPAQLGVHRNGLTVPDEADCLAERLRSQGYETAAFVSGTPLHPKFGLDQGFDTYVAPPDREWPAQRVRREASKWLAANGGNPFFCFVHFFDPHTWYDPPDAWRKLLDAPAGRQPPARGFVASATSPARPEFTPDRNAAAIRAYDAEIRFADAEIGALLDDLDRLGLASRTIVVLVSDHGESLDELLDRFGYAFDHGEFLYRAELRIPMILRLPETLGLGGATTHDDVVSTLDLMPTILELVGAPLEEPFEGRSLAPLFTGGTLAPRPVVSERRIMTSPEIRDAPVALGAREHSVIDGGWHWLQCERGDELFDMTSDPEERTNLLGDDATRQARMTETLERWRTSAGEPIFAAAAGGTEDPALVRQLKALGYLGGESEGNEEGGGKR